MKATKMKLPIRMLIVEHRETGCSKAREGRRRQDWEVRWEIGRRTWANWTSSLERAFPNPRYRITTKEMMGIGSNNVQCGHKALAILISKN